MKYMDYYYLQSKMSYLNVLIDDLQNYMADDGLVYITNEDAIELTKKVEEYTHSIILECSPALRELEGTINLKTGEDKRHEGIFYSPQDKVVVSLFPYPDNSEYICAYDAHTFEVDDLRSAIDSVILDPCESAYDAIKALGYNPLDFSCLSPKALDVEFIEHGGERLKWELERLIAARHISYFAIDADNAALRTLEEWHELASRDQDVDMQDETLAKAIDDCFIDDIGTHIKH